MKVIASDVAFTTEILNFLNAIFFAPDSQVRF